MTKQLKLSALIVAMAASTAAFANGVVPGADWTGEPSGKYNGYTTSSNPTLVQVRLSLLVLTLLTVHLNAGKMVSTKMQIQL